MRTSPNVIITGTPGVGKTVHCEQLAQEIGLKHLSVNQVAKDRDCYETYDEERKSWVVDEDKVCTLCWDYGVAVPSVGFVVLNSFAPGRFSIPLFFFSHRGVLMWG